MAKPKNLKQCKFCEVQGGTYFWWSENLDDTERLIRFCKDDIPVEKIPGYHSPEFAYCPAGVIGEEIYPFSPGDIVLTFPDRIITSC